MAGGEVAALPEIYLGLASNLASEELYRLQREYLPLGKVGGFPAWLNPQTIPQSDEILCLVCRSQMAFLLQIYCTSPLDPPHAFHRVIYLFACRQQGCAKANDASNFAAFRCQLPRENAFYSPLGPLLPTAEPSPSISNGATQTNTNCGADPFFDSDTFAKLCVVCGCRAGKRCSKCARRMYCSRTHQIVDWQTCHREECGSEEKEYFSLTCSQRSELRQRHGFTFKEFGIEIIVVDSTTKRKRTENALISNEEEDEKEDDDDDESIDSESSGENEEEEEEEKMEDENGEVKRQKKIEEEEQKDSKQNERKRLKEFEAMAFAAEATKAKMNGCKNGSNSELEEGEFEEEKEDSAFRRFSRILRREPEQILRYQRGGKALLATDFSPAPEREQIGCCALCGAERQFEFQLMPHLLSLIDVDTLGGQSLDWATLLVYTCRNSCSITDYAREFVFKQDFVVGRKKEEEGRKKELKRN